MFGGPGGFPGQPGPGQDNPIWDMVRHTPLDEQGTIMLLMQMPDFVEDEDFKMVQKHYPILIRNTLIGAVLGVAANLQLKRIPNFLRWNRFFRYGLRIPTFFAPFGLFYNDYGRRLGEMRNGVLKYQKRLLLFQKTGDFKYLDPEKKLQKKHQEKVGM